MENMFGMVNGKYFGEPPLYVNKTLAADTYFPYFESTEDKAFSNGPLVSRR